MCFIAKISALENTKRQHLFALRKTVIVKIAHGNSLFESADPDIVLLREYARKHWTLLPSATQLVESKVKDTSFCKSIGKQEFSTSSLAMVRSLNVAQASSSLKNKPEF